MNPRELIELLEANRAVFASQLRGVPDTLRTWRPHADHWCLLEVACHLLDEERDDFGARARSVVADPSQTLPETDPMEWVTRRAYRQQDYDATVEAFLDERTATVQWLRTLHDEDWGKAFAHAEYGPLSVRFFVANWVAHDYLHQRQITKIRFKHLEAHSEDTLQYAGAW